MVTQPDPSQRRTAKAEHGRVPRGLSTSKGGGNICSPSIFLYVKQNTHSVIKADIPYIRNLKKKPSYFTNHFSKTTPCLSDDAHQEERIIRILGALKKTKKRGKCFRMWISFPPCSHSHRKGHRTTGAPSPERNSSQKVYTHRTVLHHSYHGLERKLPLQSPLTHFFFKKEQLLR